MSNRDIQNWKESLLKEDDHFDYLRNRKVAEAVLKMHDAMISGLKGQVKSDFEKHVLAILKSSCPVSESPEWLQDRLEASQEMIEENKGDELMPSLLSADLTSVAEIFGNFPVSNEQERKIQKSLQNREILYRILFPMESKLWEKKVELSSTNRVNAGGGKHKKKFEEHWKALITKNEWTVARNDWVQAQDAPDRDLKVQALVDHTVTLMRRRSRISEESDYWINMAIAGEKRALRESIKRTLSTIGEPT